MLNPPPLTDVNGIFISRTSVILSVDNLQLRLFKSVHWNKKITRGKTWGNKAKPRGRGRGKFDPTADLELYIEDWTTLRNYLAGKNPARGWMLNSFTLSITAFEEALGGVFTAQLIGCSVDEDDSPIADGDDQVSRKLTLNVMDIVEDGFPAVLENTGI